MHSVKRISAVALVPATSVHAREITVVPGKTALKFDKEWIKIQCNEGQEKSQQISNKIWQQSWALGLLQEGHKCVIEFNDNENQDCKDFKVDMKWRMEPDMDCQIEPDTTSLTW